MKNLGIKKKKFFGPINGSDDTGFSAKLNRSLYTTVDDNGKLKYASSENTGTAGTISSIKDHNDYTQGMIQVVEDVERGIFQQFYKYPENNSKVPISGKQTEEQGTKTYKASDSTKEFDGWMTAVDGMDYKMIDPITVMDLQDSFANLGITKIIIMMVESAMYGAIQNEASQISGVNTGTGVLQDAMKLVDMHNNLQTETIQDITTEWMSRIESVNEFTKGTIEFSTQMASFAFHIAYTFNEYLAITHGYNPGNVVGPLKKTIKESVKSELAGIITDFITSLMLLIGSLQTMNKLDSKFMRRKKKDEEALEAEEEKLEREQGTSRASSDTATEKAITNLDKKNTSSQPNFKGTMTFTGRGKMVVNKAALAKAQTAVKKANAVNKTIARVKRKRR